jgi:hypothetical protein
MNSREGECNGEDEINLATEHKKSRSVVVNRGLSIEDARDT